MKRLFLLLFIMTQGVLLQGANKFQYLNKLSSHSQVKCQCEQLSRAWLFKSDVEKSCDSLDNKFNELAQIRKDLEIAGRKEDWLERAYEVAKVIRRSVEHTMDPAFEAEIKKAIKTIHPHANIEKEFAFLLDLAGQVIAEELDKARGK